MNKEKLKGLQSFLKDDIWRVTEDEVSKSRGILYNAIKIATLSIREFTQGRILNKASALTYSTLLERFNVSVEERTGTIDGRDYAGVIYGP